MSRESSYSAQVFIVISDLEVSPEVLDGNLTHRQDMALETRIIVFGRESVTLQEHVETITSPANRGLLCQYYCPFLLLNLDWVAGTIVLKLFLHCCEVLFEVR